MGLTYGRLMTGQIAPDPLLLGYGDTLRIIMDKILTAGTNEFTVATVPTNEIWVVTNWVMQINTNPTGRMEARILDVTNYWVWSTAAAPGTDYFDRQVYLPLKAGNRVVSVVFGAAAGSNMRTSVLGFKMLLL